ncbi:NAD-dependent epimerase/dehydratase family protein [Bacillus sp. FSL W7-1360]
MSSSEKNLFTNNRVFITGGAGFIGSSFIERLISHNDVIVYDNLSRDSLKYKKYANHPRVHVIEGDILDKELLKTSMQGATHVIHMAAIAGIDTVTNDPIKTMRVNMIGTANVLEAAATMERCDRVVCFSTSEVYGQMAFRSGERDEAIIGTAEERRWSYAVSKLAGEHLAQSYYQQLKLPTVTIRPFNIYGPGQIGEGAVKSMIERALMNEPITIYGDGAQIRSWCYVDDMIEALFLTLTHPNAVGESFNIGNKNTTLTTYHLANTIIRVLSSQSVIHYGTKNYADIELRMPNTDKAKDVLQFEAKIDLEEGIRRTAVFLRTMK